ncbi:transposase [Mediterraneibacter sp. NSJ-55]|uniref:Transposase n=1 Tax=Mediterraneibacter hominis TaxID=2763054 RepID=A0A923LJ85_9FIRM|nr:transposase [Mediterraneibacter hominis]MBC5689770.1 transposase [Mediterraneibacter hominis]
MMSKLSEESLKYIIARLVENANEAVEESDRDRNDLFNQGRRLAYYEMLDILKSELDARDADLKELGLDFDVDKIA